MAGSLSPDRFDARIANCYVSPLARFLKVNDMVSLLIRFISLEGRATIGAVPVFPDGDVARVIPR